MAKTIPQLTDATTVNAADELIIQQGGITKRATGAELAKGLNTLNGTVNVKDFGAAGDGVTDDTAAIQAAINVAKTRKNRSYVDLAGLNCLITKPLIINEGECGFGNGHLTASPSFAADDTGSIYMLRMRVGLRMIIFNLSLNGNFVANGIHCEDGGFANTYHGIEIVAAKDFGLRIEGDGDQRVSHCLITQSQSTASLRTGIGIALYRGDCKIHNTTVRYWSICLDVTGGSNLITDCHFYNGNAGIDIPQTNSVNIRITGGTNNTINNCYIDKGRVVLKRDTSTLDGGFYSQFVGNKYLFSSPPEHDSIFVFDAEDDVGRAFPARFTHVAGSPAIPLVLGGMKFIEFVASGVGSWSAAASSTETVATAFGSIVDVMSGSVVPINAGGMVYHAASDTSAIYYTANGYTGQNTVAQRWGNSTWQLNSQSLLARLRASSATATSALRLEGSRTNASFTGQILFVNRHGTNDADVDNTRDAYWVLANVGPAGGGSDTLRAYYSAPASSTLTEYFRFGVDGLTLNNATGILAGNNSPESNVTAPVGSLFLRADGGAGTTLYVKENGAGNTGWVAK